MRARAASGMPSRGQSAPDVLPSHSALGSPNRRGGEAVRPTHRSMSGAPGAPPERDALERGVRRLVSSVFWGGAKRGRKMGAAEVARLGDAPGTPAAMPDPLRRSLSEDLSHSRGNSASTSACSSASGTSTNTCTSTRTSASGTSASDSTRNRDSNSHEISSSSRSSPSSLSGIASWSCPFGSCQSLPASMRFSHATWQAGEDDSRECTAGEQQPALPGAWAWLHSSREATLSEGRKWARAAAQAWQGAWHEARANLLWLRAPGAVLLQLLLSLLLLLTPTGLLPGVPQGLKFLLGLSLLSLLLIPSSLSFPGHHKFANTLVSPWFSAPSQGGFSSANVFSLPDCMLPEQSQGDRETGLPQRRGSQPLGGGKQGSGAGKGVRRSSSSPGRSRGAKARGPRSPRVHQGPAKAGAGRIPVLAGGFSWKALSVLLLRTHAHPASLAQRVL